MKIQPKKPRNTSIGGTVGGVKWRYDPDEHADGMEVSPEIGRALIGSGHWVEAQSKVKKIKPTITQVLERPEKFEVVPHDRIQE